MKHRIPYLFICIAAMVFAACESGIIDNAVPTQNFNEPEYYIEVSQTTFEVASDGGELSLEVYVSNNLPWQATTTGSWITLSQTSGKGNATITLTVLANETGEVRQATVTIKAREKSASVTITQEGAKETPDEEIDGHAYVNLGLPSGLLWATCNVGADNPEDYGDYFAWGETTTKSTYNWSTYKWCNGSETTLTKYNTYSSYGIVDNKTFLDLSDDAARANWGGSWRMATKDEWQELKDNCTWTWTNQGGHNGYKVTSKSNGNSIFLPAAGNRWDSGLNYTGTYAIYWSSSLYESRPYYESLPYYAWRVYFDSGGVYVWDDGSRYFGQSVRPVCRP